MSNYCLVRSILPTYRYCYAFSVHIYYSILETTVRDQTGIYESYGPPGYVDLWGLSGNLVTATNNRAAVLRRYCTSI